MCRASGVWAGMEIPASQFQLDAQTAQTVQIDVNGGRVWIDALGTNGLGCTAQRAAAVTPQAVDQPWVDDALPPGAQTTGTFTTEQAATSSQSLTRTYVPGTDLGGLSISSLSVPVGPDDDLLFYVLVNGCTPLRELKVTWTAWTPAARGAHGGEIRR
jgi:hypothetical protein